MGINSSVFVSRSLVGVRGAICLIVLTITPFFCVFAADCNRPAPPDIPDGARASRDSMLDGLKAVRAFQQQNMLFMKCIEAQFIAARKRATQSLDTSERALALSLHQELVDAYTDAVSVEEEVAGDFNVELREFNALNR